jgi:hypothetical protein
LRHAISTAQAVVDNGTLAHKLPPAKLHHLDAAALAVWAQHSNL